MTNVSLLTHKPEARSLAGFCVASVKYSLSV